MKKPSGCVGCPLYGNGEGFVPDEIVAGAKVDVWLQNPGQNEEVKATPACGATGDLLNDTLLPSAGLARGVDVNVRNAFRCRYNLSNDLPPEQDLKGALAHCRVHDQDTGADVAIACGSVAWRKFDGPGTITDWRGFKHPDKPVIATLHPADLFRNPKMKLPMMMDFAKVPKYLRGEWPSEQPGFRVVKYSNVNASSASVVRSRDAAIDAWFAEAMEKAPFLAMDTEFTRETHYLLTLGIGYPGATGIQFWFEGMDPVSRARLRDKLRLLVARRPVVFQNSLADIPVLERGLGIRYADYSVINDTMLAHAVLWSEWPHTLEYLASIYGKYPKMKHLSRTNPELYNWGDVLDTISAWEALDEELKRDPRSLDVYRTQSLPLIPIILKRAKKGIRVDQEAVAKADAGYRTQEENAALLTFATAGWLLNVGSDQQLKKYCYEVKNYPVQLRKKKIVMDGDAVSALRRHVGPDPDLEMEATNGLSMEHALDRISRGADPILEARVIHSAAGQIRSHYIAPLVGVPRVYPSIKIHAQASGRWSITEPPLQQFPDGLEKLLIPDPGEVWIGWDWDQIELRILAALADDEVYLDAFERNEDVHKINAAAIFAVDIGAVTNEQRQFSKRFVYRLNYGGDPRMAGDIPGAKQLGLTSRQLVLASQRYLAAHPKLAAWRVGVEAEARTTRVSRTFSGRRRRLLGDGRGIVREAFNHPMQGAVADILNKVTIRIAQALPTATMVYTVHDAAWWAVPEAEMESAKRVIEEILAEKWNVGRRAITIPVKWKQPRRA